MGNKLFSKEKWAKLKEGLSKAKSLLERYRKEAKESRDEELIDQALRHLWRFSEYTMNALLEAEGERPDRGHATDQSAKNLHELAVLKKDYSKRLEQIEKYRRKADYIDYARERSVHFNASNLEDCLSTLRELEAEAEAHLEAKGFL